MLRSVLGSLAFLLPSILWSSLALSADPLTEAALRGQWRVVESPISELFAFASNGEFVYYYQSRSGQDMPWLNKQTEGAYSFGSAACSNGKQKGNLFFVQASERCCFNAYLIGQTLVFDAIPDLGLLLPSLSRLCKSKTLKRYTVEQKK